MSACTTEGEPFFAEGTQPSKAVGEVFTFLNQHAAHSQSTQRICALLQKHNLIQPWPIKNKKDIDLSFLEGSEIFTFS